MGDSEIVQLSVELAGGEDFDHSDLDESTRSLVSELEELPFVREVNLQSGVDQGHASPRKGAKGGVGEIMMLGTLAMAVLPSSIPEIIGFLKEWGLRPGNRPVKIKGKVGAKSVEFEFDPRTISTDKVKQLASEMLESLK